MKKILDFGPLTGRLLSMTYWHMLSALLYALLAGFTGVFILNYMIKHIGPEIQATQQLLGTGLMFLVLLFVVKTERLQRWLKSIYWWVLITGLWDGCFVLVLVYNPTLYCLSVGCMIGFTTIMMRLSAYGTNLVFRGEGKTTHETLCQTSSTGGAIVGSVLAIAFQNIDIWTAIWIDVFCTLGVWLPMVLWGQKLVLNEIDRQGGVKYLADKINREI